MTKILSFSLDDALFERFENARKKNYPELERSKILSYLIKGFLGDEVPLK